VLETNSSAITKRLHCRVG